MGTSEHYFDHEKLDVYTVAMEFAVWRRTTLPRLPRGNGDLTNQLTRASTSIVLNIAEGTGEFSEPDRLYFFRIARRSATECAAALDLITRLGLVPKQVLAPGRELLWRVVAMLTRLTRAGGAAKQGV